MGHTVQAARYESRDENKISVIKSNRLIPTFSIERMTRFNKGIGPINIQEKENF